METEQIVQSAKPIDLPIRKEFLSRGEVARLYGVSLSTVTRWARTGLIRTVRTPGGHYRYPAADLLRSVRSPIVAVEADTLE